MIWLLAAAAVAAGAAVTAPPPEAPATPAPATAVAEPALPPSTPAMYDAAVAAHEAGDRDRGAALLYEWLRAAPRADERYDVAQHLLADDLHALGFTHAAISREVEVAANRARPELLAEAIDRLEKWTDGVPHDEVRVRDELLHEGEFASLTGTAAAWIAYQQGSLDLKAGRERWAKQRFSAIPETSRWKGRARVLVAATKLGRASDDDVLAEFEAVAADRQAAADARNDARIAAARLRFERGEFDAALKLFEAIDLPELDAGRGQIYLEEAWAYYRTGQGGRAMGLAAALDAPSFRHLFLPEKHLLRAFVFRDACQLLAAKRAARDLRRRHHVSLEAIEARTPLATDPQLASAALEKGAAKRLDAFVKRLEVERLKLEDFAGTWTDGGLAAHLAATYDTMHAEASRQRAIALEKGAQEAADELLRANEQAGLIDYEVGLALYRRDHGRHEGSPLTFEKDEPAEGQVAYELDGEYWNDELLDLRFVLENRCLVGGAP